MPTVSVWPKITLPCTRCTATSFGRVPTNVGVLSRVTLSVLETPVSLAAVRSGATVGAGGATVSIVTLSAGLKPGETLLVLGASGGVAERPESGHLILTNQILRSPVGRRLNVSNSRMASCKASHAALLCRFMDDGAPGTSKRLTKD